MSAESAARDARCMVVAGALALMVGASACRPVPDAPRARHWPSTTESANAAIEGIVRGIAETGSAETTAVARVRRAFDVDHAMVDIRALEAFGVRTGGSDAERRGAEYIADRLRAMGYTPEFVEVPLVNGLTSVNVVARKPGRNDKIVVLGAHFDSKSPSPGANDNLTGTAAVLEIARIAVSEDFEPTLEFVLFGTEEVVGSNPDDHHFGSRRHVAGMTPDERARTAAMVSVDMIGYGNEFIVRTMGVGPMDVADRLIALSRDGGPRLRYLRDRGRTGWSDHEPFERAGIPSAWIEWRDDPVYHTARDTSPHLQRPKIRRAGQLTLDFVRALDADDLDALTNR